MRYSIIQLHWPLALGELLVSKVSLEIPCDNETSASYDTFRKFPMESTYNLPGQGQQYRYNPISNIMIFYQLSNLNIKNSAVNKSFSLSV